MCAKTYKLGKRSRHTDNPFCLPPPFHVWQPATCKLLELQMGTKKIISSLAYIVCLFGVKEKERWIKGEPSDPAVKNIAAEELIQETSI